MIEHWIFRGLSRFRRVLFFAALFAVFVAGLRRKHLNTLLRHPEGRALARRLEGWPRALSPVADPSRLAALRRAPQDDGGVFCSSTLNFFIPYPRPQNLTYPDRNHVSRARCGILHAASQNRDPGFFELRITGAPALQRTVSQGLHAALRPGNAMMQCMIAGIGVAATIAIGLRIE
jgi:hypothetical protein